MNFPLSGDYIDIHTHDSVPEKGVFAVENLMAHEPRTPMDIPERACTFGIHPWHLDLYSIDSLIEKVHSVSTSGNLIAIGEAGFDKLRGPSREIQERAFEAQLHVSESLSKPLIIHCVRAWDELFPVHKRMKPKMPWLIHGFRGKVELADQLISKGMYISFWFDFAMRNESSALIRSLPADRIFLETDGAGIDIRIMYEKVAADLNISSGQLMSRINNNFRNLFNARNA